MKTRSNKFLIIILSAMFVLCIGSVTYAQNGHRFIKANANKRHVTKKKAAKHNHHIHNHYNGLPKKGVVVKVAPKGATIVKHGKFQYHCHNGVWYKPHNGGFVVFRPHSGIHIKVLPSANKRFVLRNRTYYYYYGTYYVKADKKDDYEVVDPPIGAMVEEIPNDYTVKEIDGQEYFVIDEVYYKYIKDKELYEVVKPQ